MKNNAGNILSLFIFIIHVRIISNTKRGWNTFMSYKNSQYKWWDYWKD